ncbi:related to class I alpha-mannosidase [Ramularia collo-cygni]|uniref:alpha-1,2-Mannosidase n=1 Tax=Ramularia collo-cygni TaxID=112498 RepID=A0A2D3VDN5_9PEZI|nr:related to class I alpha-mannosidase [Ramularia collo-cygni]CZT18693.1 related to class I alpha-mannosidase [Ramularia collo-cygni]
MPGPRRVRSLAIVVCIAVVFLLYQRSGAVQRYAEQIQVGGGAVLRGPQADQKPAAPPGPPQNPLMPEVEPEAEPAAATTEQRIAGLPAPEETTTSLRAIPTTTSKTQTKTEKDTDRSGYEITDEGFVNIAEPYSYTTPAPQHWSKQPEHYPITSTIQLPKGPSKSIPIIQHAARGADEQKLAAVKEAAQHAWKGYRNYGWGFDEVAPVTGKGKASFCNWGATLVDSLDTLWIMGMKDEFEDAVNQTSHIDFTTSSRNDIPLFEVTIRYLGGLLAAYDVSGKTYRVLLDKAVELAEILYSAFDTPNRMPETYYHWKPAFASNKHRASGRLVLAELGTLNLEFTRLAQLTGEPKYYDAIARITDAFEEWQNSTRLPGMWPIAVDASGCNKTATQMQPSRTNYPHQMPVPGGDTYMMTSEPVKIDRETLAKAEQTLAESMDPHAVGDAQLEAMNKNVHNPRPDATKGSDLRFEAMHTPDDPNVKQKRQLDTGLESNHSNTTSVDASVPHRPADHVAHRNEYASRLDEEEEICVPQGLASPSKYSTETYTLGGQSDSVYEYLPKEYVLLGGQVDQYRTMYLDSMEPVIEKLLYRPMTPENLDILISGDVRVSINSSTNELMETLVPKGEHLTCFAGGMFAMGGKLFDKPEHVEIGRKLTDGCIWSYNSMTSGIMPESFTASACESKTDCKWNQTKYWEELDPYVGYREEQRAKFWEKYPDYKPGDETDFEGKAPSVPRPQTLPAHRMPEKLVYTDEEERSMFVNAHDKRQLDQDEVTPPSPPKPAPAPVIESPHVTYDDGDDDVYDYAAPPVYTPKPPATHTEYVEQKILDERLPPGFVRLDSKQYILRPEAIESVFYMYRITGEQYWRDMGWKMFQSVDLAARAEFGHSAIDDVTKDVPKHINNMESFWLAETLKYFYLLFDEPDRWSLDDWVLNTEAHFFERPGRK